jgi:hypothetical protein
MLCSFYVQGNHSFLIKVWQKAKAAGSSNKILGTCVIQQNASGLPKQMLSTSARFQQLPAASHPSAIKNVIIF